MGHVYFISLIVCAMFIWFETEGVIEWGKLLRLKFLKYEQFAEAKKSNFKNLTYTDFLLFKYNNFFTRLVTCPYCLSVCLNILGTIAFYKPLGGFLCLGLNIIFTWLSYFGLKYVLKKLNE